MGMVERHGLKPAYIRRQHSIAQERIRARSPTDVPRPSQWGFLLLVYVGKCYGSEKALLSFLFSVRNHEIQSVVRYIVEVAGGCMVIGYPLYRV